VIRCGQAIHWGSKKGGFDLTGATQEEREELFLVLRELKSALTKAFAPDWFNYSFLGNETRHLHGHVIPRYKKPKMFTGVTFEDILYGHNYKTDHSFNTPPEVLTAIQEAIKNWYK